MSLPAWIDRLALDLRHSVRVLGKAPLFTTVAVLSLALGIGANTGIFSIVYALMLKALPVAAPQQLVQFTVGERGTHVTNPIWEAIRDRQRVFDGALAFSDTRFDRASGGEKQPIEGIYVNGEFFQTLGVPAFAGRTFTRDDDRRGGGTQGPVAVLSHAFWRDRYRSAPAAVGSTIRLDGHPFTIVGVTPPGFFGARVGATFDVAVPIAAQEVIRGKEHGLDRRTNWWLIIMGRLKPGTTLEQAQAGLRALAPQVREATLPPDYRRPDGRDWYLAEPFTLRPAATGTSYQRTRYRASLLTLMGAVALVLLIACANLANLLLARASARRKEFAVRLALGAARGRLVRQLLTESLLVALAGAALGVIFSQWASRLIVRQIASSRSVVFLDLSLDWSILGFTMGVATLTAVIFGLAPACRSTDLGAHDLMKSSSRSVAAAGWRGVSLEKTLVVVQIAFSLVLVFGAALFVRTFTTLATLDPGFDRRQVLFASVDMRRASYPVEQRRLEHQRVLDTIRALPGIRSAAATDLTPISGSSWQSSAMTPGLESLSERERHVYMNRVSDDYFETLGTPILAGRDFGARDAVDAPAVAIVNEMFARTFFRGESPIGRTFTMPGAKNTTETFEIVGLARDSKYVNLRADVPATVFVAQSQQKEPGTSPTFVLRSAGDLAGLTRSVTTAMRGVNEALALEFRVFETVVQESLLQERLIAMLSGFFGGLALLVAGVGLYGVMSLAVSRRRQEIGIRMALGAAPAAVVWMVLRDVAIVTLIGLSIGAVSGVLSGRFVRTLLFGLEPSDLTTWLLAIAALAAAAAVAGYLPARRAARLDPMHALREE